MLPELQVVGLPSNLLLKMCNRTTQTEIHLLQRDVCKTDKYSGPKNFGAEGVIEYLKFNCGLRKETHFKVELTQGSGSNAYQWYVNAAKK